MSRTHFLVSLLALAPVVALDDSSPRHVTGAPNSPPIGVNDSFEVDENATLNVAAPGVLVNDSDPDGDPIEVTGTTQPANGLVQMSPGGSFQYTPDPDFSGFDSFLYGIADDQGNGTGNVFEVLITVVPGNVANQPPVGVDDTFEMIQDTTLNVAAPGLLANDFDPDGDPISVPSVMSPTSGTFTGQQVGSFQYTPDPGFIGIDSFFYAVEDDQGANSGVVVEVVITVTATPDPTTAPTSEAPDGDEPVATSTTTPFPTVTTPVAEGPGILIETAAPTVPSLVVLASTADDPESPIPPTTTTVPAGTLPLTE